MGAKNKYKIKNDNSLFLDNIIAPATAIGEGAIGIIRISGIDAIEIAEKIFFPNGKKKITLKNTESYKMRYGVIKEEDKIIDDILLAIFRAPASYTGENCVEIYCHSSTYIINTIILIAIKKANQLLKEGKIYRELRMALEGEFTQRAFLNGKMDLAQAEAVADLIASENEISHSVAMNQMRGGFSKELRKMKEELLNLASLMELELDFSEEDVEFADREKLSHLIKNIHQKISSLSKSFSLGNVIRNGIPVAIVGAVNTGKSTLLNLIVGEEKAIVSDIQGTTRDTIEDVVNIEGTLFRFIDTAGIRKTKETIEILGIERTYKKIETSSLIILMLDYSRREQFLSNIKNIAEKIDKKRQEIIVVVNKTDLILDNQVKEKDIIKEVKTICTTHKIKPLEVVLCSLKGAEALPPALSKTLLAYGKKLENSVKEGIMITNIRHYQALINAENSLNRVISGLENTLTPDLLAQDLREAISDLASITGEISSQDVLNNIFKNFCIGK